MHFITFVAVPVGKYPICKHADKTIKARIEELSKMEAGSIGESVHLKCTLSRLRSLTNSFARAVDDAVDYKLAPYCECTEDEKYLEFIDGTEEAKAGYEKCEDCIKLSNGKIVSAWTLNKKFVIKNGLVYQRNWGPLKQDKRTKKAKRMVALMNYPLKKRFKTYEEFAEDYYGFSYNEDQKAYGYYCNPNSFWDWYQIGGRWPCSFLVKEECEEYAPGEYDSEYELPAPPQGYKWTSASRKKDIQWQTLIEYKKKQMKEDFERNRTAFENKELPKDEWYLKLRDDGVYAGREAVYLAGETFEANQVRRQYLVDSDYLKLPYYYVDDKNWHAQDQWWDDGSRIDTVWKEEVKEFYDSLSDETVLVSVDCHS